jgi:AraC family transcriptional regulator
MQTSAPVELEWWCDGKSGRRTTNAGSLILLAPGTVDALKFHRPSRRLLVAVEESMLSRAASELEIESALKFENRWAFEDNQLRFLLFEIEREMVDNWSMGRLYGDLLAMALSLALVRNHSHSTPASTFVKGGLSRCRADAVPNHVTRCTELAPRVLQSEIRAMSVARDDEGWREPVSLFLNL